MTTPVKLKQICSNCLAFVRGVFSECDGSPSASRVLMFILALWAARWLGRILWMLITANLAEAKLALWLAVLPTLIGALAAFAALPYGANKAAGAVSGIGGSIADIIAKLHIAAPTAPPANGAGDMKG